MLSTLFKPMHGLTRNQLRNLLRFAMQRLGEDRLPQVAGSLTFTTTLSLVPLFTIALAIFTAFPLFNTFRDGLEAYFVQNLMPKGVASTILGYLNQFSAKSARLSALGGVALILTSVLTMATIDRVFNQIWRVKKSRPVLQRILVYWAIISLGPLLIGVSFSVTSTLYSATNGVVTSVPLIGASFFTLISVLLTTAAFTLLYVMVPNQWVDWRDAIWGGLLAGVGVEIAKRLFAAYVLKFPTYTVVYGAVAALPIFLLWIYMLWMITLVGALLTAALPVVRYERWWHIAVPGSEFVDALQVLRILHHARTNAETSTVDMGLLRARTHLGLEELQNLLQKMLEAGWVGSIKAEAPKKAAWNKRVLDGLDSWTLIVNPDLLKLDEVYRLFVFDAIMHAPEDQPLLDRIHGTIAVALNQSLTDYFCLQQPVAGVKERSVVAHPG
ncbi:membrane protein [Herbaspirillum sp. Sphag1AN]|uniref:YihY family inner membrane protein n=1 Tax=unclassified Herbaspirillum TaxID=2624150 RepID=UPI0018016CB1|nr:MULTISPECIES: YihY family inner membrane protein [unclassified Herbaspirillum]MBB3211280.1 membrane protein [Herbaspirillum sp. Sphag1AN]MBB3244909.1 membrane protein [Herbaspirillum sp. Sphag64]